MPFFFIVPIWVLCVIAGVLILFSNRFRFLASYLILGSTFGVILSFLVSTALLLLLARVTSMSGLTSSFGGVPALLGYVAALIGGAAIGVVLGAGAAYRLNRRLGLD